MCFGNYIYRGYSRIDEKMKIIKKYEIGDGNNVE